MSEPTCTAAVSIILPTYNRAKFLPEALGAIRAQHWTDWELIVVDDGSNDDSDRVVKLETSDWGQSVTYVRQANQGAYGARNTGLDHARGALVAFFDSDDLWLPHHLADCAKALQENPKVDWVFGACRRVDHPSGQVLLENTFYDADGEPWRFLRLQARQVDRLRVLEDKATLACMLAAGLNCGLQASVIRREVFEDYRFQVRFWNEAEDQMLVIWALAKGKQLAYFNDVHVVYRVHAENSSATETATMDKRLAVLLAEARGYEDLSERGVRLSRNEQRAYRRRLLTQYFWNIGYSLQWQSGRRREALTMFRRGLAHWPWDLWCWKTYLAAQGRALLRT